ncbi:MAG TPA: DDE-type integrase/transposase/recombinase [Candidatus Angelobacter sp.]
MTFIALVTYLIAVAHNITAQNPELPDIDKSLMALTGLGYTAYLLLAQYLELNDINQLWVADITYVRLQQEFVYLAVVLDAYSRRVSGWALSRAMNSALVVEALDRAIAKRQPGPRLVHHSGQSSQCMPARNTWIACWLLAVLSMSRLGRPWENGRCESFLKTAAWRGLLRAVTR